MLRIEGGRGINDGCSRVIDYLRVSVTDRCNLRCIYMHAAGRGRPARP